MKVSEIKENEKVPSEWDNDPLPLDSNSVRKKMRSLEHQADLMMQKLYIWQEKAKGFLFAVTGPKAGLKLPKQVEKDPRQYDVWTLSHENPNVVTKVYCFKGNLAVSRPIRALVARHNELTNKRAEMEGILNQMKSAKK